MFVQVILVILIILIIANIFLYNSEPTCYDIDEYYDSAKMVNDERVDNLELFNKDSLLQNLNNNNTSNCTYIDKFSELSHISNSTMGISRNSISEFPNDSRVIEKELVVNRRPIINRSNQIRDSGYSDR